MQTVIGPGNILKVKKGRVKMVGIGKGSFTQRVVNAWNCLLGKVLGTGRRYMFKLELDRYLEALEIKGGTGILAGIAGNLSTDE